MYDSPIRDVRFIIINFHISGQNIDVSKNIDENQQPMFGQSVRKLLQYSDDINHNLMPM